MVVKFGFDIDDTLINLREHAFTLYNKHFGTNVPIEKYHQLKTVEIHELFGLTSKEGSELWSELSEKIYFTNCPAFDGTIELLNSLVEDGHDIFYITSRPKQSCERTRQWMKNQGFPIKDDHFFCGMQDEEKIEIIKQLNLDVYVDDKPKVLETLQDVKTEVYVKDQSYNQHVSFRRVKDWKDFKVFV